MTQHGYPPMPRPLPGRLSIVFTCRDNGGLSLLAEALANHGQPHLRAFSGSAERAGPLDIAAVECLHGARVPADGLSAKPLELFALAGAPRIHAVVAMVETVHGEASRFAARCGARLHLWRFEEVAHLADTHARRLAYRRLLPALRAAIGELPVTLPAAA